MSESILDSTKKILGIATDDTSFDEDVIMHINSAIAVLHQLGIGPLEAIEITDNTTQWSALLGGDARLNPAKNVIYLRTKLIFDPPATSAVLTAIQEQINQLEWRLNIVRENSVYVQEPLSVNSDEGVV